MAGVESEPAEYEIYETIVILTLAKAINLRKGRLKTLSIERKKNDG
jgi:hypothetical protein